MKERKELETLLPRRGELFDVVVAGGGPAGLGAALASAAEGAKTLLLEARGFFGGVAAVSHWMPMNRIMLNGGSRGEMHDLFVKKIKQLGPDASVEGRTNRIDADNLDIHPEYLRLAAFELLEESGCKYRLHSPVTGVVMEGNRVTGVRVLTKDGSDVFNAGVFVDASGDGDVEEYGKHDGSRTSRRRCRRFIRPGGGSAPAD
jgi:flavin-dependent dehydrogenase